MNSSTDFSSIDVVSPFSGVDYGREMEPLIRCDHIAIKQHFTPPCLWLFNKQERWCSLLFKPSAETHFQQELQLGKGRSADTAVAEMGTFSFQLPQ